MRIRKIRKRHALTLQQVADACGFTRSLISKIETGKVIPPVATLAKIADFLGATVAELLAESDNRKTVYIPASSTRGRKMTTTEKGYRFHAIATERISKLFQPYIFVAEKGKVQQQTLTHRGEEFVYVLEGSMKYRVGNVDYTLEEGDSLYFDSEEPHDFSPITRRVRYLAIFCEPASP